MACGREKETNEMKRILCVLVILTLMICCVSVNVQAAKEMFTALGSAEVIDVVLPVIGEKPALTATSAESGKYTVAKVSWSEYDEDFDHVRDMTTNDTFREGYYYFVFINLEAKGSCTFNNNMTQIINGKTANKYTPSDNNKKVQIYTHFKAKKAIKKVELSIVSPVIGKTPTFAKVNTTEYESKNTSGVSNQANGVSWTNQASGVNLSVNNPFKENTKYTVKYYLTAKDNYLFSGTKYYMNGKQVSVISSNGEKTQVVVALTNLLPGDGKKEISSIDLVVAAPADGEKPNYTKIEGTGYYSDNGSIGSSTRIYKNGIAWYKSASSFISPGTTETFIGGNEYILKVALTPKEGYKFASKPTVKINDKGSVVETFDDGSIIATVTLSAPKKGHIHTESTWQKNDGYHWKVCTDASCGSLIGKNEVHKDLNKDKKCDVCGYKITVESKKEASTTSISSTQRPSNNGVSKTETTTGTGVDTTVSATTENESEIVTPEVPQPDSAKNSEADNENSPIIWIFLGAIAVIVIGAVITIILKKKKQ